VVPDAPAPVPTIARWSPSLSLTPNHGATVGIGGSF
jgi:hypothetical protein